MCKPTLSRLDDRIASAFRSGALRLVSLHWLLHVRPAQLSMLRMAKRQELEALVPSPFLSSREAVAAVRSASRRVLVLTYPHGSHSEPDPTGAVLRAIERFLDWFVREFQLDPTELKSFGLFWDFPCLHQLPRTHEQETQFGEALDAMAGLYASPLATTVLQHRRVPPRPSELDGLLLINGVPSTVAATDLYRALGGGSCGGLTSAEPRGDQTWELRFATHQEAQQAEVVLGAWASSYFAEGRAALAYNERTYQERGWCFTEQSLCREVVGRSRQRGFERVRTEMETLPQSKLYEISETELPVPMRVEAPQDPEEVMDGIRVAAFSASTDVQKVLQMYRRYHTDTTQAMEAFQCAADAEGWAVTCDDGDHSGGKDSGGELNGGKANGGKGGGGHHGGGGGGGGRDMEMERRRRRGVYVGGLLVTLLHTLPLGLVQVSDYFSDLFVLAQFWRTGDVESFFVGALFVGLSIVCAWGACLVLQTYGSAEVGALVSKHGLVVCLLAPLNLHVLYIGMQHAHLKGRVGDDLALYKAKTYDVYYQLARDLRLIALGVRDKEEERGLRLEAAEEVEAIRSLFDSAPQFAEVEGLYALFVGFKVIETGLESVPLSILTAGALFGARTTGGGMAGGGTAEALLRASLVLSLCSMAYGFFAAAVQMDGTFGRPPAVQGKRAPYFLAILLHAAWVLAALGSCWGSPSLPYAWRHALPRLLMISGTIATLGFALGFTGTPQWPACRSASGHPSQPTRGSSAALALFWGGCRSVVMSLWASLACVVPSYCAFFSLLMLSFPVSIAGMAVDVAVVIPGALHFKWWDGKTGGLFQFATVFWPIARRLALTLMAAASLVADYSDAKCAFLACFQAADCAASYFLFAVNNYLPSLQQVAGCLCRRSQPYTNLSIAAEGGGDDAESRGDRVSAAYARAIVDAFLEDPREMERAYARRDGYLETLDMLDGLLLPADADLEGRQHVLTRASLQRACGDLKCQLPTLSPMEREVVNRALGSYLPSADGSSESELLAVLYGAAALAKRTLPPPSRVPSSGTRTPGPGPLKKDAGGCVTDRQGCGPPSSSRMSAPGQKASRQQKGRRGTGQPLKKLSANGVAGPQPLKPQPTPLPVAVPLPANTSDTRPALPCVLNLPLATATTAHPMCGVLLSQALRPEVWASRPSFLGRTVQRSHYELSYNVAAVSYFVSHAWPDNGARKLSMLREFLFLQEFCGKLIAALPLLAVFLVPTGFGVSSLVPSFAWWLPSMMPLGLLAMLMAWVMIASFDLLPQWMTPWAHSATLLWLDTCCLDQSSPTSIAAGFAALKDFLRQSERMVAFVSPQYFRRLWTVYELATFCRMHEGRLESRLLLLSLDWPSTLHPCAPGIRTRDRIHTCPPNMSSTHVMGSILLDGVRILLWAPHTVRTH